MPPSVTRISRFTHHKYMLVADFLRRNQSFSPVVGRVLVQDFLWKLSVELLDDFSVQAPGLNSVPVSRDRGSAQLHLKPEFCSN